MCTVAFVPSPDGGYLLGHNRDENRGRAIGLPPRRFDRSGRAVLAPRDPDGGGTWISVNDSGLTLCVLNALESDPSRLPAQPRSRGLILWDLTVLAAAEEVDERLRSRRAELREVRSFHLLAVEQGRGRACRAVRLRWNGIDLIRDEHEGPSLFVSSSLAPVGVEPERSASWRKLLDRASRPDAETLADWLASHDPGKGPLSVCMHRPEGGTVSRTLVLVSGAGIEMRYLNGPPCTPLSPETSHHL
jgi:hypothetical protein